MNENAYSDFRVRIVERELLEYISSDSSLFDIIIADLPDPRDIQTNQFYTLEFFDYCKKHLYPDGIMVTQAGSPYFATRAFESIRQSMQVAGFEVLPLHNQVLTLGEWGWMIGLQGINRFQAEKGLYQKNFENIRTVWLNQEAVQQITSFGKTSFDHEEVLINTLENPILYQYYLQGNWDLTN